MVITWRAQRVTCTHTHWKPEGGKKIKRKKVPLSDESAAAATHAAEGGGKSQSEPPIAQGKKGAVAIGE